MSAECPAPRQGRTGTERAAASEVSANTATAAAVCGEGCWGALPAAPRPALTSPPSLRCSPLRSPPAPPRPAGGVRAQPAAPPLSLAFFLPVAAAPEVGAAAAAAAEALPWCRRPPGGRTPAAARRAAETWGKFASQSVSTDRAAAPAAAGSPAPGATGRGPAPVRLHLPSPGVGGVCELAARCRAVPQLLRERGRPCPAAVGSAAPEPGRDRGVRAGRGWDGGREFLSRPVLWVMEGAPGKRRLASETWRNSFLQRHPHFCVDLDLKSTARMVV